MNAYWTPTNGLPRAPAVGPTWPSAGQWLAAALAALQLWRRRARQRRRLAALGDFLLDDLGLSRADALSEAAKPFWRA